MEISKEMLAKAKEAKTYDELKALADANGVAMTEEDAKAYFSKLHPQSGALADDELDYVAGGCGGYGGFAGGGPRAAERASAAGPPPVGNGGRAARVERRS